MTLASERNNARKPQSTVLMLLTNAYDPDPRVRQEALALIRMGCRVKLLAWDRDMKIPASENVEGVEVERVFLPSKTRPRHHTDFLLRVALFENVLESFSDSLRRRPLS